MRRRGLRRRTGTGEVEAEARQRRGLLQVQVQALLPETRRQHHHGGGGSSSSSRRRQVLIVASSTVASLLSLALILWLALRPSNPSFSLLAATATVATASDNASSSAGAVVVDAALYDQLQVSVSYAGVALGAGVPLPPLEQLDASDQVLAATLTSSWSWRPSAPGGQALLRVCVQGQLRWRVAAWVSGRHGLTVDCIAAVVLQPVISTPCIWLSLFP